MIRIGASVRVPINGTNVLVCGKKMSEQHNQRLRLVIGAMRSLQSGASPQTESKDRSFMFVAAQEDFVKDYRELARALPWDKALQTHNGDFRMLDACCGTGRWAQAFSELVLKPRGITVHCDFVDMCSNSIDVLGRRVSTLQNMNQGSLYTGDVSELGQCGVPELTYDLIVNMHGLYGLPQTKLASALQSMYDSLAPGGTMFIALGAADSAYQTCPQAWDLRYSHPDDVLAAATSLGIHAEAFQICYHEQFEQRDEIGLKRFLLEECLGNTFPVNDGIGARPHDTLATFAGRFFDPATGMYRFNQDVTVIQVRRDSTVLP